MESKKSVKADLEWKRPVFFEIGLCAALALTLMAFELIGPREKNETTFQSQVILVDDDVVLPTKREQELPPPPPAPPMTSTVIEIVSDNIELENDGSFDTEISENDITETYDVEEPMVEEVKEEEIFAVVEEEPAFPGGEDALFDFIGKNIVYPRAAREAGIEGTVMVEFVVEPNGKLSHVTAIRKVAPALDEEAIRVVKMMPTWSPGKQRGKAVRARFRLPINFQLSN
ncbi:MAG: energy transducer TonB [Bacteroidales bacterium]|jgi:protein TonB|nr:energy transducer TonB [Bacteroidales bacterium]MBQ5533192.1 energy transducer TonB [Bacteroidales bacterium]